MIVHYYTRPQLRDSAIDRGYFAFTEDHEPVIGIRYNLPLRTRFWVLIHETLHYINYLLVLGWKNYTLLVTRGSRIVTSIDFVREWIRWRRNIRTVRRMVKKW